MKISQSNKRKRKGRLKVQRNPKTSNTKLLLNIVAGERAPTMNNSDNLQKMQRQNIRCNIDILRTRRFIINDTINDGQPHTTALFNNFALNRNTQNVNYTQQFSNSVIQQPLIPGFSNRPVQQQMYTTKKFNQYNILPQFISKNEKAVGTLGNDDVICLDSSQENNSVTMSTHSNSFITINDSLDDGCGDSVITLDSSEDTPYLSKFQIVVANTDFDESKTVQNPKTSQDDVICIDAEDKNMECTNNSIDELKSDGNDSVISIDDNSISELQSDSRSKRQLKPQTKVSLSKNKHSLIYKKKDQVKQNICIKKSARKLITYSDPSIPEATLVTAKDVNKGTLDSISNTLLDKNFSNIFNSQSISKTGLREIIIDGSNVALSHSNGTSYSIEGLKIVIDYFVQRGHKVRAFVPQFRLKPGRSTNTELLRQLIKDKHVILTPSRFILGKRITPYDDRFIIQYATSCEGIVVSNDCYRDLIDENPEWRKTIENRLLMPTWIDNVLMFPEDPLGRFGPKLTDFLMFPSS